MFVPFRIRILLLFGRTSFIIGFLFTLIGLAFIIYFSMQLNWNILFAGKNDLVSTSGFITSLNETLYKVNENPLYEYRYRYYDDSEVPYSGFFLEYANFYKPGEEITIEYLKNNEVDYHVDLAIYVKRRYDNYLDLAKGKEFSDSENRFWEISDPKGLISKINNRFSDSDEMAQMRRCIRYFKRWRDYKLYSGKPFSIALTVASFYWFSPYKEVFLLR